MGQLMTRASLLATSADKCRRTLALTLTHPAVAVGNCGR
jgi:hypothetical protein